MRWTEKSIVEKIINTICKDSETPSQALDRLRIDKDASTDVTGIAELRQGSVSGPIVTLIFAKIWCENHPEWIYIEL